MKKSECVMNVVWFLQRYTGIELTIILLLKVLNVYMKVYKKTDSSEILLNLNISFFLFFPLPLSYKNILKKSNKWCFISMSLTAYDHCQLVSYVERYEDTINMWRCQRRKQIPFLRSQWHISQITQVRVQSSLESPEGLWISQGLWSVFLW